jgi:hypothetical protein
MTFSPALIAVLFILGVYRGTRFVTRDEFPLFSFPRDIIVSFFDPSNEQRAKYSWAKPRGGWLGRSLAYLAECDWCASVYVAGLFGYLTWRWTEVMGWVLLGLTASAVTGLISASEAIAEQRMETEKMDQMRLVEEVRRLRKVNG